MYTASGASPSPAAVSVVWCQRLVAGGVLVSSGWKPNRYNPAGSPSASDWPSAVQRQVVAGRSIRIMACRHRLATSQIRTVRSSLAEASHRAAHRCPRVASRIHVLRGPAAPHWVTAWLILVLGSLVILAWLAGPWVPGIIADRRADRRYQRHREGARIPYREGTQRQTGDVTTTIESVRGD